MKRIFSLLLLLSPLLLKAKDIRIELLTVYADVIVQGEVQATDKPGQIELKTTEYIKGSGRTVINIFAVEDTVYHKKALYTGDQVVLFIKKKGQDYELIKSTVAALPVLKDSVTLTNEHYNRKDKDKAYAIALSEFKEAIRKLANCMVTKAEPRYTDHLLRYCSDADYKALSYGSKFSEWLYRKVKARYRIIYDSTAG